MKKNITIVIMCTLLLCTSIAFSRDYTVSVQGEGPRSQCKI
jgi:type 1 fimbria pilin